MVLCEIFGRSDQEPERKGASFEVPEIIVSDYEVKTRGKYRTKTGLPKGLIVHYTAGRNNPEGTLRSLAKRGLGCLVMDEAGTIYRSKTQPMNQVAYHAGKSAIYDVQGLSYYCMGMEICNAGKLDGNKSWFGETYPKSQIRTVTKRQGYSTDGNFHKYTREQELSLRNFCLWQLEVNPEFSIDWVLGHDEIAIPRGRKSDPSGAFSLTMPEFRSELRNA